MKVFEGWDRACVGYSSANFGCQSAIIGLLKMLGNFYWKMRRINLLKPTKERCYLSDAKQNVSAAAALLEYGARVNLPAGDGLTPLHEAVGAGSLAIAEMMVRAGAQV